MSASTALFTSTCFRIRIKTVLPVVGEASRYQAARWVPSVTAEKYGKHSAFVGLTYTSDPRMFLLMMQESTFWPNPFKWTQISFPFVLRQFLWVCQLYEHCWTIARPGSSRILYHQSRVPQCRRGSGPSNGSQSSQWFSRPRWYQSNTRCPWRNYSTWTFTRSTFYINSSKRNCRQNSDAGTD